VIDEAIEKLKNTPVEVVVGDNLSFALAKRLGIEALERLKMLRDTDGYYEIINGIEALLPSETEEKL